MSTLLNYLNQLDQNAIAREFHASHPMSAMKEFGLNDDEVLAMNSGGVTQVAYAAGIDETNLPALQSTETVY